MKVALILLCLIYSVCAEALFWNRVDSGYKRPLEMKAVGDGKFLVLEQRGMLYLTDLRGTKGRILDWDDQVKDRHNEQGFLSFALAPDFSSTGRAYFNLTNKNGDTEIWRYTFNPKKLSTSLAPSERLMVIEQPYWNHNGGWLDFGPDGMLYIAVGDGGSANDPNNHAQDLDCYLGKLLRIDVSPETGYRVPQDNPFLDREKPEIFAYGLRNPWRCHWHDSHLIIADVGQNHYEELNYVHLTQLKGANFGWRLREGQISTPKRDVGGPAPSRAIDPVLTYPHDAKQDLGGISITGGAVYNGRIASLKGFYLFADYGWPRVWAARLNADGYSDLISFGDTVRPNTGAVNNIASFATDSKGEIYILCFTGDIFRLAQNP